LNAMKSHVKIDADPVPGRQIRNYRYTAKLKISVLCNFEYLAIYNYDNFLTAIILSQKQG